MKTFQEFLDEQIKGWKHAGRDLDARRQSIKDVAKTVHLHRLTKDGSESGMHDARKPFASEEEARQHHDRMKSNNPGKPIAHRLYVNGEHEEDLK